MILYLDTSSLVKLYVEEDGSDEVRELAGNGQTISSSWVAYAEARSAFARRYRGGGVSILEYGKRVDDFERDWGGYLKLDVHSQVLRTAGQLTEKHGLRALDAIHLASALDLKGGSTTPPLAVVFSSADRRLQEAARAEGLEVPRSKNGGH